MTSQPVSKPQFEWDAERRFPLMFAGFVALSVFAHITAFFIFQVKYPARVTIPPPAAQVTVLSADIPAHRGLLAWIAAEDPALAGAVSKAQPPGFSILPYKASFEIVRTWPRAAPAAFEDVPMPPGQSGWEFIQNATTAPPADVPRPDPASTRLEVSGPLAARKMSGEFTPDVRSSNPLTPTRLLIGVDSTGAVRHVFLQDTSGEASVDEFASRSVKGLTFAPAQESFTWGFVTIAWGDDVLNAGRTEPGSKTSPKP